jgi:selenocysteine-specific elongation factor
MVLDVGDRVVLWEAGRRRTVGGGTVLDVAPPRAVDDRHRAFLARRAAAPDRSAIAALAIEEAGAIRADDLRRATGAAPTPHPADGWYVADALVRSAAEAVTTSLRRFHAEHPLDEGAPLADVRADVRQVVREARAPRDPALADAVLQRLSDRGDVVRTATVVRLPAHTVGLAGYEADIDRLLDAIGGEQETTPPTVKELIAAGFDASLIDAAGRAGVVVRLSPELVVTPNVVARAEALVRERADDGTAVSQLRETLATSRKYAVPLAEWMDAHGVTRRVGDLRYPAQG